MKLVYISGPHKNDPVTNTRNAIEAADRLFDTCVPIVPHLATLWDFHRPRPLEDWYAYDLEILARCDALLRIAGPSYGADLEVRYTKEHHIPVFFGENPLRDWLMERALAESGVLWTVYGTQAAAEESGLTYRQIDHYDRTGMFSPSAQRATGSGSSRYYSEDDVRLLRIVRLLIDSGVSPGVATMSVSRVRDTPIMHGICCIIGEQAIVGDNAEVVARAVKEGDGQPVIAFWFDRDEVGLEP